MPGRPLIRDLRGGHDTICRSCLAAIRRRPAAAQQWTASYSSQASKAAAQQAGPNPADRRSRRTDARHNIQQAQPLPTLKKENTPFSIRFFEQSSAGKTELSKNEALAEASELKDEFLSLQSKMGEGDKGALQDVISHVGDLTKMTSVEEVEKLMARLDAYRASIDEEIERTGADLPTEVLEQLDSIPGLQTYGTLASRSPVPQIPEKQPWTINQRKKISRLNAVLARASREMRKSPLTKKSISSVYKAYHAARMSLAHGWSHVPQDVWDLLWQVFAIDKSINSNRLSHIALLARDMSEARVTLSPSQQLLTIEAVFVDGWESKALENWKRCVSTLGDEGAETFKEFWELGVRMYCRLGDLEQAQRAINKLLEKKTDPRIMMPLIRTCSELDSEEGRERAWNTYRQMREFLGQDMKLIDYDQVISYFLTANQTENALYAFVDMMSDGEIDLKKQKFMPSVVANKFFFGKWLKRLIGAKDLTGAFHVVQFMREKGLEAAPIHLNGLIGAWQRAGGVDDLDRADELAWGMIDSRINFVKQRRGENVEVVSESGVAPLPRATRETFSLMAENYRLRGLLSRLEALWAAFRDAEIKTDAFMMNQLLESYIQAGQAKEALEQYHTFVTEHGIAPDPYTFSALWKTLGINRLQVIPPSALEAEATSTRALFAETARFQHVFASEGGMDGQLARKILHTFRRVRDPIGLIVALTALRDLFHFLPPETLVLEMVLGTTKLSWDTPAARSRLLAAKRSMERALLASVGGDASKLEDGRRAEALFSYLQQQFWPTGGDEDEKRRVFLEAAEQMGVFELLSQGRKK